MKRSLAAWQSAPSGPSPFRSAKLWRQHSPLHIVARQHTGRRNRDAGHQSADGRLLALAGLSTGCAGSGPSHGPGRAKRRCRTILARGVRVAYRGWHGHVRHWRRSIGLCWGQTDLAPAHLAKAARASVRPCNADTSAVKVFRFHD